MNEKDKKVVKKTNSEKVPSRKKKEVTSSKEVVTNLDDTKVKRTVSKKKEGSSTSSKKVKAVASDTVKSKPKTVDSKNKNATTRKTVNKKDSDLSSIKVEEKKDILVDEKIVDSSIKEVTIEEKRDEGHDVPLEEKQKLLESSDTSDKKIGFNLIEVVIIMVITVLFGVMFGSIITFSKRGGQVISNGTKVPSELHEFISTYESILDSYYEDVDKEELIDAAIKGMIDKLGDPYSNFLDQSQSDDFNITVTGDYVGIGVQIMRGEDGFVVVSQVFDDSPAFDAGIQVGDQFLEIAGEDVNDHTLSELSELIKGKQGTKVSIKLLRGEEEIEVDVLRRKVELSSVSSDIYEQDGQKIGYISLSVFAANTSEQFRTALESLEKKGIDSLIIDVRDNSGGHLTTVSDILSMFLDKKKVMYQTETKGKKQKYYALTNEKRSLPVVVLVNGGSASASEILAAAMKESYGAVLVGKTTYGKGTVQIAHELSTGATIKYTIQKWLTPNGNWINEVGIVPDVVVDIDTEDLSHDVQLERALETIISKK